ncbi:glycoside hydrolase family 140 protein [Parapedobacter koreensis]|uniref:Putative collagen-binding domain of a collagenase n=1 Tax=Parapedobacter koreensis TaxID=332977 RepID=A0A1H7EVP6_9SPHI|nr:glycoside hydrolase family 140 protein [Parapedobacter koreensis]SEK17929.1 Putative collagen-binding domain of a collagenase [Parapedobacter koreensis]
MKTNSLFFAFMLMCCSLTQQLHAQEARWTGPSVDFNHGRLMVDTSKRHIVFENGEPFPYFGDTAWELFHRLDKKNTERYLENRREKGFTVIQAVVLAELDGLGTPTPEGATPLMDNNPLFPNEPYFAHVDWVVQKAREKGLFIGMLPTWGDKVDKQWGVGPEIFTPENAFAYGKFLGERYRACPNIIWIIGGDRSGGGKNFEIWDAMACGIRSVDNVHLMTFHPQGERSSAEWFHESDWLDFNMVQTGHAQRSFAIYKRLFLPDYHRTPIKPVMDAEPRYENHPVNWAPDVFGWFDDADVRQTLYWSLFSGGFGYTYGCHSIWQMRDETKEPVGLARSYWHQDLDLPGAWDIIHARNLLSSRPVSQMRPFPELITNTYVPETDWIVAARGDNYVLVYIPTGSDALLNLALCDAEEIRASWFNPRTGDQEHAGRMAAHGVTKFSPPTRGRGNDWVLMLDYVLN